MAGRIHSVTEVRQNNIRLIIDALQQSESATKMDIASETGLSVATCNNLLNELMKSNLVSKVSMKNTSSGRPPVLYQLNPDYEHILCIYLISDDDDKRLMEYSVFNLSGEELNKGEVIRDTLDMEVLKAEIGKILAENEGIRSISIGIGGYLKNGRIQSASITELEGELILDVLKNEFNVRTFCGNDMNRIAFGFYESFCKDCKEPIVTIGLFKGKNPGAGAVVDGKVIKGFSHFAGEVQNLNEDQKVLWKAIPLDEEAINRALTEIMLAYITTLNPRYIFLTGSNCRLIQMENVLERINRLIPEGNVPEIQVAQDYRDYYLRGLFVIPYQSDAIQK